MQCQCPAAMWVHDKPVDWDVLVQPHGEPASVWPGTLLDTSSASSPASRRSSSPPPHTLHLAQAARALVCDLLLRTLPARPLAALCLAACLSAWPAAVGPALAPAAPASLPHQPHSAGAQAQRQPGGPQARGQPGQASSLHAVLHAVACDLAAEELEEGGQGSPETAPACSRSTQGTGPGQLACQARACLRQALGPGWEPGAVKPGRAEWSHVARAAGDRGRCGVLLGRLWGSDVRFPMMLPGVIAYGSCS